MRASWRYRLGFTPSDPRTRSESASSGSSKTWSSVRCHQSSNATDSWIASSTSNPGGSPASSGCSARIRCANVCRVEMTASSIDRSALVYGPSPPSAAASCSTCSRTRSCSSLAAAVVNVMMPSSSIVRVRRSPTTRSTSSWVLPVPAPATTFRVSPRSPRIRSRAAWSAGTGGSTVSCGWALTRPPGGHAARRRWLPSGRRASRRSPARGRASRGGRSRRTRTRRTS